MKNYFYVLFCLALSGCFLDQNPPPNSNNPAVTQLKGGIIVSNYTGFVVGGEVLAGFWKPTQNISRREFRALNAAPSDGSPACDQPTKTPNSSGSPGSSTPSFASADPSFVSVGTMSFGLLAATPTLQTIPAGSDLSYHQIFKNGLTPGIYVVQAAGGGGVPAFSELASLSEPVVNLTMNRTPMQNVATITRGTDVTITWDKASPQRDDHVFDVIFQVVDATDTYILHCAGYEKFLETTSDTDTWKIPATYFSLFPAVSTVDPNKAVVQVTRLLEGATEHVNGILKGNQYYLQPIKVVVPADE